jgi:hypothetical protein
MGSFNSRQCRPFSAGVATGYAAQFGRRPVTKKEIRMMIPRRLTLATITAVLATAAFAAPAAASNASCAAQFVSVVAMVAAPLGQTVVVPEVRNLAFGGPNLGQEVKLLFATADRDACPVTP